MSISNTYEMSYKACDTRYILEETNLRRSFVIIKFLPNRWSIDSRYHEGS